jgi:hypothetical protein
MFNPTLSQFSLPEVEGGMSGMEGREERLIRAILTTSDN